MVTRALQACASVALLVAVVGCQRGEAWIRLDACLSDARGLAASRMATAETDCDFGREVWVVGIPPGTPTAAKLQTLGVPKYASLSLAHDQYASPQWCVVVEDAPAQVPHGLISQEELRQFTISCTPEDQEMQDIKAIHASEIRFKVTPKTDGAAEQIDVSRVR